MIRFFTAGESHGPLLTAIVDGLPAGLPLTDEDINGELLRRQQGYGAGGRMAIERDTVRITSGVMNGVTTGGPIALLVENRDFKNWKEKDIAPMTVPRPGHADLTGAIKYGYRELRVSLERASARETTMRVAVGAICRRLLREFGVIVGGYTVQIGAVTAPLDDSLNYEERFRLAEESDVRCPDAATTDAMHEAIRQIKIDKDTLGGVFEVVALNVPPGLGSFVQFDRKLDARIVAAMISIQAMKGAEIGPAFANAGKPGSQVHDAIYRDDAGNLVRRTNRAGGLEGGVTTGDPIVVRVAMKPIATILQALDSVDLATGEPTETTYERSDFCALPRAVPIGEAMLAIVLADALCEKLGGDSLDEMRPRFDALRRARLDDLPMDNVTWRFGYE
ncbi:MAG TPA: chorismate synthase [Aggregatilineales bacterium]|nr:chorismate synthase [Aggregatilineales bacterium]